ncbi:MAG: hypothetical protein ACOZD0_12760 [Pseudomonadota bacterium]
MTFSPSHASVLPRALRGLAAAVGLLACAAGAQAADVGVSVSIADANFYGRVDIGNTPPPLIYAQPVIIHPARVKQPPIYLRVPPGQEKKWSRYCARYDACGRPVYFVRRDAPHDSWHRPGDGRADHPGTRDERRHDDDRGRRGDGPHGHGHDNGRGHGRH